MACPYFYPTARTHAIGWAFPHRLPLGGGFCGTCRASAEESVPDEATLRDLCNLGHAGACSRMPSAPRADSVCFAVAKDSGERIFLHYVLDREHTPVAHGKIEYDCARQSWLSSLDDVCVQRQAECYLALYLERRPRP